MVDTQIQYRLANPSDLESLLEYHIANHIEETAHCEGEEEN